uniref:G-protein coupled receptors family 1 profile domain-containing protein n=1 Tax=Romanomermis culicivorax TaxID=13658 RepID=A0A915I7R3_ROMCU
MNREHFSSMSDRTAANETKNECRGVDDFAIIQFVPLIIDWHFYKNIFNFYIVHFVQVFLPISALILLNVVILWRLRLRYKYQRVDLGSSLVDGGGSAIAKISNKVKGQQNVREAAYSMVAIVTTYLACNSLSLFISIVEYFRVGWVTSETLGFLADIVSFLFLLNSFLRLFIHLLCNGTLRSTVRQWTVVRLRRCAEILPFSVWSRWKSERLVLNSPRCVHDPCHSESLNYCDVIMENGQTIFYESTV